MYSMIYLFHMLFPSEKRDWNNALTRYRPGVRWAINDAYVAAVHIPRQRFEVLRATVAMILTHSATVGVTIERRPPAPDLTPKGGVSNTYPVAVPAAAPSIKAVTGIMPPQHPEKPRKPRTIIPTTFKAAPPAQTPRPTPAGQAKGAGMRTIERHTDTRAQRACLRCDRVFPSESRGNRICPRCKHNESMRDDPGDEPYRLRLPSQRD
jgi:hypothetical protein